jgi:diadenosine tetraphosphate (Ap4A) HIT family hydrolase
MAPCFVCDKHRDMSAVPGGELIADEHAVVSHLPLSTPAGTASSVYLGYLFVEPRRHVAELGELTADEASAIGRLVSRASAALHQSESAEHVYAAVIGHGIEHLHVHLIARYPGTPREFWWTRVDEWPDAPRGDAADVAALADRLRSALAA